MQPYLYAHPNPHAPVRSNGVRFWGYPQRQADVDILVVHTAENVPDTILPDGGAEAVARFQTSTDRPSSYHELVDADSHVLMLPPEAVAFGARGANADGWHISFATKAHMWRQLPASWVDATLERGAARLAAAAALFGIPLVHITRAERDRGAKGVIGHGPLDPTRRTDPDGPNGGFPWDRFMDLARDQENNVTPEDIERIAGAVWDRRLLDGSSAGRRLAAIDDRTAKLLSRAAAERTADELGVTPDQVLDAMARRLAE